MATAGESRPLDFKSAGEWRRWLARNHARSAGEWLFLYKNGARRSGLRYQEALDEALCFGWIDGKLKAFDSDRYIQRFTPRRKGSVWSAVNKAKAKWLIADGRMVGPGLAAVSEAKKSGKWQAARSRKTQRPDTPLDLRAALAAVAEATRNYEAMASSHKRAYILWVNDAKKPETRQRRIAAVVRLARLNRKPDMDSPYK